MRQWKDDPEALTNSGSKSTGRRKGRHQAQYKVQESRNCLAGTIFQFSGRTRAQQLAQNQTQIECSHVDQLSFQNVLPPRRWQRRIPPVS